MRDTFAEAGYMESVNVVKFKMKYLWILIVALIALIAVCAIYRYMTGEKRFLSNYREALKNNHYIMHATGGVDNKYTYVNSMDAVELAYDEGERFFEVDVSFTLDKKLVLAHCNGLNTYVADGTDNIWNKNDWEKRMGQTYDPEHPLATYDEFMQFKLQGRFTASSFAQLIEYMKAHKDMYVTLDVGNRSYNETVKIYSAIADAAGNKKSVLNRFIAGGQTTDMVSAVKSVYDFPLTYLYYDKEKKREDVISTPEKYLKYCLANDISCFATSYEIYSEENLQVIMNSSLFKYVYTVDDKAKADKLLKDGFSAVGTNFLREKERK